MSIRRLRARLERLQAQTGARYVIGQDRHRDRKRRQQLFYLRLNPGLTDAQTAEMAELDACFEKEDRDSARHWKLFLKPYYGESLTEEERTEYAELRERYPPDPNDPLRAHSERFLAALEGATPESPCTGGSGAQQFATDSERDPAIVQECITSQAKKGSATCHPATDAPEKLNPASPDEVSDAELLEQLILAANGNLAPGEGIDDIGPIKAMLESGIELDDVLYTLRGEVNPRVYPKNRTLASWSESWFIRKVAEAYGRRVILPVLAQKLGREAPEKPA
jgi:hypothetical protein